MANETMKILVRIDEEGDWAVCREEGDMTGAWEEQVGGMDAERHARILVLEVCVPTPQPTYIKVTVPEENGAVTVHVEDGKDG